MKVKVLVTALVCVLILGGCSTPKVEVASISTPDLSTEEGIREYLIGDWVFDKDYLSDFTCNMSIDEDLNIDLSFRSLYEEGYKEDFTGRITLDRQYAEPNEAPDIISIDLVDTEWPGGDYFFLHRTAFDGKFVMSLFFAGNGDGVFGNLEPTDSYGPPEEIMFEKVVGGSTALLPRVNEEFHAVFWGMGDNEESFWLDDVDWSLREYTGETIMIDDEEWDLEDWEDFNAAYPSAMTLYENDVHESVLYSISSGETSVWYDDLYPGEVYFVKTDENGKVTTLVDAEYNARVLGDTEGRTPSGAEALALDILKNDVDEVKDYLNNGMELVFTGETIRLEDWECHEVILGERYEDGFWAERTYAVNNYKRLIYFFDEYNDGWALLGSG